jgi:hypothetical protein
MEGNDFNDDGEDSKPPALSPSLLKPKTIVSTPITNVQVLSWLEKQHPSLADSFIADFNISSNKPTWVRQTTISSLQNSHLVAPKRQNTPITPVAQQSSSTTQNNNPLIAVTTQQAAANIVQHYLSLDEDEQKDIWLAALASNNLDMIATLSKVHQRSGNALLAKLTKKLAIDAFWAT